MYNYAIFGLRGVVVPRSQPAGYFLRVAGNIDVPKTKNRLIGCFLGHLKIQPENGGGTIFSLDFPTIVS